MNLRSFMDKNNLIYLNLNINPYTWLNIRLDQNLIQRKIDRVLVTIGWRKNSKIPLYNPYKLQNQAITLSS